MAVAIGHGHIKVWLRQGVLTFEPCEDDDCVVDGTGHAACGRDACPLCGCGGANLSPADGGTFCTCGHWWRLAA